MWGTEAAGPLLESGHPDPARKWKGGASAWLAAAWSRPGRLLSRPGLLTLGYLSQEKWKGSLWEFSRAPLPFPQKDFPLPGWLTWKDPQGYIATVRRLITWGPLTQKLPGYSNYWLGFSPRKLYWIWEAAFSYWFGVRILPLLLPLPIPLPLFLLLLFLEGKQTQCKDFLIAASHPTSQTKWTSPKPDF